MTTKVSKDVLDTDSVGTIQIEDDAVTTVKINDAAVSTAKLAADAVDGTKIAMGSDAQGDILYRGASDYERLAKGTNGQILTLAAGVPSWADSAEAGLVQEVYAETTAYANNGGVTIPFDDTIPQNTEGAEAVTVSITPTDNSNKLIITGLLHITRGSSAVSSTVAMFKDSDANAIEVAVADIASTAGNTIQGIPILHRINGSIGTSSITFKLRYGSETGTSYINGTSAGRRFGGVLTSWIRVVEVSS